MSVKVKAVAQMAMTTYFKGFRPANAPFRLEHFVWLVLAADAKLKQDEYDKQVNLNRQMRMYLNDIALSVDNYDTLELPLKDNQVKLPMSIMFFSGDKGAIGINSVEPVGGCSSSFIRINSDERWAVCKDKNAVFWYPEGEFIKFVNIGEVCTPEKIKVSYIPQLSDKGSIQDSRKWAIVNLVVQFLKAAENGTIIDMSNDGNANTASQTEINKYLLMAAQGK